MIRNYLKIALRNLFRHRLYSSISIMGLAISIACCLLMLLYIHSELTYDTHHDQPEKIYRLVFDNYMDMGAFATTPFPIGRELKNDFPEIKAMTRLSKGFRSLVRFENQKFFENISFVDTGLINVFKLDFVMGNPYQILSEANQVILSESTAKKFFGNENPMGKTMEIGSSGSLNSVVTGVFKDFPQNSTIEFDLATSFATFTKAWGKPDLWEQMPHNFTYIRLRDDTQEKDFAAKLPDFAKRHVGGEIENWQSLYKLALQPLLSIHLRSDLNRDNSKGNLATIKLLATIAFLVLLIACINYVNYATARFARRAREVSIRKVVGAGRGQLIRQFLGETLLISFFAGALAMVVAEMLLPSFNLISGKIFISNDLHQSYIYGGLSGIILLVGFGAGIFPALFLSGFRPAEVLKGKFANLSVATTSRKGLVILQFTASIVLLVATLVVFNQMQFVRTSILSDSQNQVVVFQINRKIAEKFEPLKQQLLKISGVLNVSGGSNMPTFYGDSWPLSKTNNPDGEYIQTENYAVENDFIETLGYELIAGRALSKEIASDVTAGFVLNERAVKTQGFESPEAALGQTLYWGGDEKKKGTVVGVVKDFHFESLHAKVEPAVLQFAPYKWMTSQFVAVSMNAKNFETLQNNIQKEVARIDPEWLADLKFLDDNFFELHQTDLQQGRIFGAFALLAIFISCLGLLGLATFSAEQRTKEIGIRKVLGASIGNLIGLLSRDFLKLVVIALLVATPLAWYGMREWLSNFAYRIDLEWWMFVIAGMSALGIAFLTVSFQSVKAALANPVESLRNE